MTHIRRNDNVRARSNSRGEHVAITGIRENEVVDQRFVAADQRFAHRLGHQLAGAGEPLGGKVRTIRVEVAKDLIEDLFAPPRSHDPGLCESDEQIAQRARVEDIRVVDRDPDHWSGESEFASLRGQLVGGCLSRGIVATLVVDECRRCDPTVTADLAVRQIARFE